MFDYDASSVDYFSDEMVHIEDPAAGTWYVGVQAWEAYTGLELMGSIETVSGGVQALTPGVAVNEIQGNKETFPRDFSFYVPPGTSSVRITLSGSNGDLDMYVRHGSPASVDVFDYQSIGEVTDEVINITNPDSGTWYINIGSWLRTTDGNLVVHYNLGSNTPPAVEAGPPQSVASGATVSLTGTGSDAQGAVTYQWTQLSGPAVTLSNANTANASFTAPTVSSGTPLLFRLTVTDSNGVTNTDVVRVAVGATTVPMNPSPWTTPVLLETTSGNASELRSSANKAGYVFATWIQNNALYARVYDPTSRTWSAAQMVSGASTSPIDSSLSVDLEIGTAVLVWRNSATGEIYSNRFALDSGTSTYGWRGAEVVATVAGGVTVSDLNAGISMNGVTAVIWNETNGTTEDAESAASLRYGMGLYDDHCNEHGRYARLRPCCRVFRRSHSDRLAREQWRQLHRSRARTRWYVVAIHSPDQCRVRAGQQPAHHAGRRRDALRLDVRQYAHGSLRIRQRLVRQHLR